MDDDDSDEVAYDGEPECKIDIRKRTQTIYSTSTARDGSSGRDAEVGQDEFRRELIAQSHRGLWRNHVAPIEQPASCGVPGA